MRTYLPILSFLLVVLPLPSSDAAQSEFSPWANFGVGSWVVVHTTMSGPKQSTEQRLKMIIVRKKEGRPVVGVARQINGKFEPRFRTGQQVMGFSPRKLGMAQVKTTGGRHTIDGRRYDCTVKTYHVEDAAHQLSRTLKLWYARGVQLPYREIIVDQGANVALAGDVVKAEYEVKLAKRSTSYSLEVTSLNDPLNVGSDRLQCAVEKGTAQRTEDDQHSKIKSQRWISDRVPGHVVQMRGTVDVNGAKFEKTQRVEAFEVKH